MTCAISTGEYVEDVAATQGYCGLSEMPVDPTILFDANSTGAVSRSFSVAAGETAVLTVYNSCGCTVGLEKVLFNKPHLPLSSGSCECRDPGVPAPEEVAATNICSWQLGNCNEVREITMPGMYRLRLSSLTCVGCAVVTMERVRRCSTAAA